MTTEPTHAIRQSALLHRHRHEGGLLTSYHGWQVAEFFSSLQTEVGRVRESAGVADVSWMVKFDLQGWKSPPPMQSGFCWSLHPHHFLVTCDPADQEVTANLLLTLASEPARPPVYVTDVTSVYAQLLLAGPRSRAVLSKLTSLDVSARSMPNLSCGQTSVAHVHAIVLRQDLADLPAFHLLISREYAESFWDSILHAGREFHLSPFGLAAYNLLRS